jgi:RND family efflux transporter MFP subunit
MNEPTDERAALLDQLRIDRTDEEPRRRTWPWLAGGAALVAGAGLAAWLWLGFPAAVVVEIATAEPVAAAPGAPADAARGSALDASGYVVARRQATVSSKVTGKVVEVLIEEGQRVEAGQVVARLDDTNARAKVALAKAQRDEAAARLAAARVAYDNTTPIFERNREQYAKGIISAQDFDAAKADHDAARTSLEVAMRSLQVTEASLALAQRDLDDTVVRAPFAGILTVKAAQPGEMVSPVSAGGGFTRTGIGTIVDMQSLEVEVDVSESFINRVRPGQDVQVKLNAYPDWTIPAHVLAIIPTADRAKATVKVRVALEQTDARILPEMGVRVAFLDDGADSPALGTAAAPQPPVLVPTNAVQANGDTGVVYVIEDDTVERRTVRLGARSQAGQVVLSGLASGARLAVADFSRLADGARVRVAN